MTPKNAPPTGFRYFVTILARRDLLSSSRRQIEAAGDARYSANESPDNDPDHGEMVSGRRPERSRTLASAVDVPQVARRWTDAQLLVALRAAAADVGEPLRLVDFRAWRRDHPDAPAEQAITRTIRRLVAGCAACCWARLLRLARGRAGRCLAACAGDLGRPPSLLDYRAWRLEQGEPRPSTATIEQRLGGWTAAAELASGRPLLVSRRARSSRTPRCCRGSGPLPVEVATAGDEAEGRLVRRRVDPVRRERILRVLLDTFHGERDGCAVLTGDGDLVARFQLLQAIEDGGSGLRVDVARDDARPGFARFGPVLIPPGHGVVLGGFQGAVGLQSERDQRTIDIDARNPYGDRAGGDDIGGAVGCVTVVGGGGRDRGGGGRTVVGVGSDRVGTVVGPIEVAVAGAVAATRRSLVQRVRLRRRCRRKPAAGPRRRPPPEGGGPATAALEVCGESGSPRPEAKDGAGAEKRNARRASRAVPTDFAGVGAVPPPPVAIAASGRHTIVGHHQPPPCRPVP